MTTNPGQPGMSEAERIRQAGRFFSIEQHARALDREAEAFALSCPDSSQADVCREIAAAIRSMLAGPPAGLAEPTGREFACRLGRCPAQNVTPGKHDAECDWRTVAVEARDATATPAETPPGALLEEVARWLRLTGSVDVAADLETGSWRKDLERLDAPAPRKGGAVNSAEFVPVVCPKCRRTVATRRSGQGAVIVSHSHRPDGPLFGVRSINKYQGSGVSPRARAANTRGGAK